MAYPQRRHRIHLGVSPGRSHAEGLARALCLGTCRAMALAVAMAVVGWMALSGASQSASFNCSQAATAAERLVCADAELGTLDEHLAQYYSAARLANPPAAACLQADQRQWLRQQRERCSTVACLQRAYLARLAELQALQPGATAIRYRTLPDVPALVWLLPADPESAQAKPAQPRKPLVLRGHIVNDVAQGEGYVLQDRSGQRTTLLALMFIDAAQGAALDALARAPGAVFEARGQAEQGKGEAPHFWPGACTAIYRLPA